MLLYFEDAFAAADAGTTRADGFQDGGAVDRVDERVELDLVAGQFDRVRLFGDIDDAATEDIGGALHFLALLAHGTNLDQHQLAFDMLAFGQVHHLHHFNQTVQVLGDLLDDIVGTAGDDGHARQGRVFGRRHRQCFDVVAARREQAHHARQGARFVFQQDRNNMAHDYKSSEPSIISDRPLPAFTMGHTFSDWSVIKFMNTSLSFKPNASFRAPSTSPGFSIFMPTWPYASASFSKSGSESI